MVVKIKKEKAQKRFVIKRKLKFKNYENCLESTKLENKINHLKKIGIYSLKKDHEEFLKKQ